MYIRVRVTAGARKERVTKEDKNTFYIQVKEPAERNMANKRIRAILAQELGVSESNIRLLTGHQSPTKMYSVEK